MPEQPCAFHPDRMTGVSCSRCSRPICPDDMVDAAVGVHCPICAGRMREGPLGQTQYRVQTRLERSPVARRLTAWSLVPVLIAVNAVIFVLMFGTGRPTATRTLVEFGGLIAPLPRSQWWRLFTSMFVHIGVAHLLFNMFALFLFGRAVEERYGKVRFLVLYLASGLLGGGASLALTTGGVRAGASGGVFGILGAWIAFYVLHRAAPGATAQLRGLAVLVGFNVYLGVTISGIDNAAHMGGLLGGFVLGLGLELGLRRAAIYRAAQPVAFVLVLVLALALIAPNSF